MQQPTATLEHEAPDAAALSVETKLNDIFYGSHPSWGDVDKIHNELAQSGLVIDLPLNHIFTKDENGKSNLYTREIFMPAGSFAISKIHRRESPFVISKGRVSVWTEEDGVIEISAPFTGVTTPGTRRLIYAHEDTIWSAFFVTNETDLAKIEEELIFDPEKQNSRKELIHDKNAA
jgi:hypothetical protein